MDGMSSGYEKVPHKLELTSWTFDSQFVPHRCYQVLVARMTGLASIGQM